MTLGEAVDGMIAPTAVELSDEVIEAVRYLASSTLNVQHSLVENRKFPFLED